MRLHSLTVLAGLCLAGVAHADTVSATAVTSFSLTPSADALKFNAFSTSVTVPGTFTQTGTFTVGDSGSLAQNVAFSFNDVFTVNGISHTLTFTGIDHVTVAVDYITINALNNVLFGNDSVSFAALTSPSLAFDQSTPVSLTGTVTSVTPEPSSFVLLGTGLLGLAAAARRRIA